MDVHLTEKGLPVMQCDAMTQFERTKYKKSSNTGPGSISLWTLDIRL